jgi:two-component system osmolarity sensor histidine kinase EnvZ
MERMLNEYLEFARGEGSDAVEPVDLGGLLAEAMANAERAHNAAGRVTLGQSDNATIAVRRHALMRCLTNLIDNALKYGRHAEVSVKCMPRRVEIAVDDDGPGIPEERREEAFRPFHRLDEGRNLQVGGVGLGLSIARDIARSHGGDILLQDSPRGGLRAVIRLPI